MPYLCLLLVQFSAKTLPKELRTQALTALTSIFGMVGLVWQIWFGRFGLLGLVAGLGLVW